ncbi:flagellar protein FliO/FliZ [Symbiobacterium terraclitae]|uniref:Flagellar protein FliO/FliZ n=1 Tax=Symbiobacterium terraclitae TaxID=557451 RepID=A0ABS4JNA7_9FIRM|nr:flagellar biosynthetic protein FliO [Symbiobacterium terraclitae]MBP2017004.1 flagellar protein FliO/FliZ [Symbiobacterium terraclitae]
MNEGAEGLLRSSGGADSLLVFLLGSLLVIALAFVAVRWLAHWQYQFTRGRRMRVLEGLAVGRDRHLLLVQVGKEILLLGSADGSIRLIHRIDDPSVVAEWLAEPQQESGAASNSFAGLEGAVRANVDRMRSLLSRKGGGGP